ncbi:MAG: PAS domain S-box-containing protein [Oleiphilaceae bacterium]
MVVFDKFAELRQHAEAILKKKTSISDLDNQDIDFFELLHELDTYRIELELQNDELQQANNELEVVQKMLQDEISSYSRYYELASEGYITVDKQWSITKLNMTFCSMLARNKNDVLDHKTSDFIYGPDQDIFYFYQKSINDQPHESHSCELRLLAKTGDTTWVTLTYSCKINQLQNQIHLSVTDISTLKLVQDDLGLVATVFEESKEAIMVTNADLKVIKVNKAFSDISGYSTQEIIGQHALILQSDKHEASFYQQIWDQLEKQEQWQGEVFNKHKNGDIYSQWLSITVIKDTERENIFYIGRYHTLQQNKLDISENEWDLESAIINDPDMIGVSPQIQNLLAQIDKIAAVAAPVMITGESGTGKELAAKAIHDRSSYSKGPFVAVNCGAIASSLVQAELFGYEKGAFTDAKKRKIGFIESANGGTIFLDEVGDLPLEQQVNLLRFLQEQTIQRVGGTEHIAIDARVIAATHVDLDRAVKEGRLREDLYYRLNVLQLRTPSLREHSADIEILANYFFNKFSKEKQPNVKGFSQECIQAMKYFPWPGNVREMMNRIRRGMVMCDKKLISSADLGIESSTSTGFNELSLREIKDQAEKHAIQEAIARAKQNIALASRHLGISRVMLYRLMNKYDLV